LIDNAVGDDDLPMSILTYANGPGFEDHYEVKHDEVSRVDLSKWDDYTGFETRQPSTAPLDKETHSGTDVAIFATGLTIIFMTQINEQLISIPVSTFIQAVLIFALIVQMLNSK
jgi:hypothetical protein